MVGGEIIDNEKQGRKPMSESNAKNDRQTDTVSYVPVPGQPVPAPAPATQPIYNAPVAPPKKKGKRSFVSAAPGENVDTPSTPLAVLCFFFPVLGAIFWLFLWLYGYYHKAKSCKYGALIGMVVWLVALVITAVVLLVLHPWDTAQSITRTSIPYSYSLTF
jgi:hypothetical protein